MVRMRFDQYKLLPATVLALAAGLLPGWAGAEPVWVKNQGARLVIGQDSFTRQDPIASRTVLGAAQGVAYAGNRLFIADGNRLGAQPVNNRILIYNAVDTFVPAADVLPPQQRKCPACVGVASVVLGQAGFATTASSDLPEVPGLNNPSAVHSDGVRLAVADTNNNRVLLWQSIPTANGTPPEVVVGQADFTSNMPGTSATSMRGPQGVWLDGGRLFVADTQNSRILIWNSIPTSNGQTPDIVVGQPDFDTRHQADLTQGEYDPDAQRLLDPVSVTVSQGRMFVADLGFNRVLIYNSVPTQNHVSADVVIGQPDFTSGLPNDAEALCEALGPLDDDGSLTENETPRTDEFLTISLPPVRGEIDPDVPRYPRRCERTLSFPRFALVVGQSLFVSDAGNDRIMVYDQIPTANGVAADSVIGQADFIQLTESESPGNVRSPSSMAYDGQNLYVTDPFTRRVLVFTPGEDWIELDGIRNAAAVAIHSRGHLEFDQENPVDNTETEVDESQLAPVLPGGEEIKITLDDQEIFYTTVEGETAEDVRDKVVDLINNTADLLSPRPLPWGSARFARGHDHVRRGRRGPADVVTLEINGRKYSGSPCPKGYPGAFSSTLN